MREAVILLALLASLSPAVAQAEDEPTLSPTLVTLVLRPGHAPAYDGPSGFATVLEDAAGERLRLLFDPGDEGTLVTVRSLGYFDIARPMQIFPQLFDDHPGHEAGHFFLPVHYDPAEASDLKRIANATGTGSEATLRLLVPGPGQVTLTLERDVTPPGYEIGPVTHLTHVSFLQNTTTTEAGFGNLRIRALGTEEWVENPTQLPAPKQTFPVQGLKGKTDYEAFVTFLDWSGNENVSGIYRVTTLAEPEYPPVLITPLSPAPGATVEGRSTVVSASFVAEAFVTATQVRVFFDLVEISDKAEVRVLGPRGNVTFTADLLKAGLHRVSVEVIDDVGGKGSAQWSFRVAGGIPGPTAVAVTAVLGVVAIVLRPRRAD